MAVSPNHRFLYAALRSEPYTVASFALDPASGRLTHLANAPLAASMAYIVTDRSGRFLLCASYPGSMLAINSIDAQGRVPGQPTQIIPTKPKAHCILVDPTNKYCYATSLGGDIVMEWKFDAATGRLSPNSPDAIALKPGNGPRHLAVPPDPAVPLSDHRDDGAHRRLCHRSGNRDASRNRNRRHPAGRFHEQPAAADLHITPDGRFIYGSERKSSTLAGFTIDEATGKLSPIGRWPTEKIPRGFNIDPRGRFLLAAASIRTR